MTTLKNFTHGKGLLSNLKPEILKITYYLASNHALLSYDERINEVIHCNHIATLNTGFWFKNEYFGNQPDIGTNTRGHLLHKSLKHTMEEIYKERMQSIAELAQATIYCKLALRCASKLSEYLSLLPEQFAADVKQNVERLLGLTCDLPGYPEEFIQAFKTKYVKEETALKNQLVYNLLQG